MQFGPDTTANDVIDGVSLKGRTAVVTGANSGIGFESARAFAAAGAAVVVTARDKEKADDTVTRLRELVPNAQITGIVLELGSLASVREAADNVRRVAPAIHILLNNAGIMFAPLERTREGFESQFGVNHLGHFLFTLRLIPSLVSAAPARIVNVSSSAHMFSDVRWDDIHWERATYDKFLAYSQSKTANVLFAVELDRRLASRGVRAFSLHPGGIRTNLLRYMGAQDMQGVGAAYASTATGQRVTYQMPVKSIAQGAATSVWAAVSQDLSGKGGLFLADCRIAPPGSGEVIGYMPYAVDGRSAQRLWELSEQMTGEASPV